MKFDGIKSAFINGQVFISIPSKYSFVVAIVFFISLAFFKTEAMACFITLCCEKLQWVVPMEDSCS